MTGFLDVMGATAGALALLDRLQENPKGRKMVTRKKNPTTSAEARELYFFVIDAGALQNQTKSIIENLRKKMAKGAYDHALAVKLWRYLADAGAKEYLRQNYSPVPRGFGFFTVGDRNEAAALLASHYIEEIGGTTMQTNPRGRSRRPITRPSQANKKKPTKRLIQRRAKTLKGPKGFYANPVRDAYRYHVQTDDNGTWISQAKFLLPTQAEQYARALARITKKRVRVFDYA